VRQVVHARGHILLMSPRCHPELAGQGIEYCWGAAKLFYRRHNDCKTAHMHANVVASLQSVTLAQARKFARRARSYRRTLADPQNDCFQLIEKTIKVYRTHRDAGKFDCQFIRDSVEGV
jgi:hypothetical protein